VVSREASARHRASATGRSGRPAAASLAAALLLTAVAMRAPAAEVGVKLRLLESASRLGAEDWALVTLGTARVTLSASSENVKAEVAVDTLLGDGISLDLARASIGVRFPGFRLTVGKARLSWGEGAVFNVGDLLFGGSSAAGLDLTAEVLRDDAAWLAAVYVPLGRFSFVETAVLPPPVDVVELAENPLMPLPDPSETALGGRVVGKLLGIKTEAAYLFRGAELAHHASVSLQGNLFVDWHLSASASLPAIAPEARNLAESLRLSAGLFHLQRLGDRATLSLRLETLLAPGCSWNEEEPSASAVYGILLYPELALDIDNAVSVTARALVSPVDGSALLVPGVSLSLHKGLAFLGMATVGVGDATDSYGFDRPGGLAFLLGCTYTW
jgi:hypothetical protein